MTNQPTRVRWKPRKSLSGDLSRAFFDDSVHSVSAWYGDMLAIRCHPAYRASIEWAFVVTDSPTTCILCLAEEP